MGYLERIGSPEDLRALSPDQTRALAQEIRDFLVASVAKTGGHLGPNLGMVELTLALHRVFDSPRDTVVFDTGHQAYVHKLVTGRQDFAQLRQRGGLSGYPSRSESPHDVVENSHASTAISWAAGIARGYLLSGQSDRRVVAVIGDGALTGGMAWEALNNIAAQRDLPVTVVVNDNGRSYAPTIGGLAHHLDTLRTTQDYEAFLTWMKRTLRRSGAPGRLAYTALHGIKTGLRDMVMPQGMFEDLGLKYLGPVNGHDLTALEQTLTLAHNFAGPTLVHVNTIKGHGYTPAEEHVADRFHAVGPIHPETGLPVKPSTFGWTAVFADEIVSIARQRADVVALTAAMLEPVGLAPMAQEFPDRVLDVGIAEQHAVTAAAGLAFAGLHPVVALYATFLNRAFDQVLMDAGLHHAGVTFALDRAGATGDDGPSHNGMWDMAMLRLVPGLRLAVPRDEATLRSALRDAVAVTDAPTVVRYPKGPLGPLVPAIGQLADGSAPSNSPAMSAIDVIGEFEPAVVSDATPNVLIVALGPLAATGREAGERVAQTGARVTVTAPTWVLPLPDALVHAAARADLLVTIEDGLASGGIGAALVERLATTGNPVPALVAGLPHEYVAHGSRAQVLADARLTPDLLAADITARLRETQGAWMEA